MECVTELANAIDGFDWRFLPVEPQAGSVANAAVFAASPLLGGFQHEAIFEYGAGLHNLKSYRRMITRDQMANEMHNHSPAGPTDPAHLPIARRDQASVDEWQEIFQDLAQADLTDDALRLQLVLAHLQLRSQPREVISFEPHIDPDRIGRLPNYGVDYEVGDFVQARAVAEGRVRFNGWFRVWGATFNLDSNNVERVTLTTEPTSG
jgi:hypothetical protein